MGWIEFEGFLVVKVCFFQLVSGKVPQRQIKSALEGVLLPECLFSVVDSGVDLSNLGFDHCQVVQGFAMAGVVLQSCFVGFDCEVGLSQKGVDVADVVPDVCEH